jgi:hypothetical protein
MYCGARLPVTSANSAVPQPTLAVTDSAPQAYSAILLPRDGFEANENTIGEAGKTLGLKNEDVAALIATKQAAPIAYLPTRQETESVKEKLAALGWQTIIVAEKDLKSEFAPNRVRALEFSDESIVGLPAGGQRLTARWQDLILIVTGRLIVNRAEIEQPKRRSKKPLEKRELSSDEAVLDLYSTADAGVWRIAINGFDFSCLGPRKGPLASENFVTLTTMLRERAANVVLDDSYMRVRRVLSLVWPIEPQKQETHGRRRTGGSRHGITTATILDNEEQFTRYSRLRYYLRLRELQKPE